MFMNFWSKAERKIYRNIPLRSDKPSYCPNWCGTVYFIIFRSCHWKTLWGILGLKNVKEILVAFLLKLQAVRIIQCFLSILKDWLILYENTADIFRNVHFLHETV